MHFFKQFWVCNLCSSVKIILTFTFLQKKLECVAWQNLLGGSNAFKLLLMPSREYCQFYYSQRMWKFKVNFLNYYYFFKHPLQKRKILFISVVPHLVCSISHSLRLWLFMKYAYSYFLDFSRNKSHFSHGCLFVSINNS